VPGNRDQEGKMQNLLSTAATLAVLVALSGILPMTDIASASAQEARLGVNASSADALERSRPETVDIDALTLSSDFTVFMSSDCSPELQLKALRKLWTLLPPTLLEENAAI
jgi:hypothetical protein